ncbi:MAG: COG2907: Amine oxidase, flavin-containing [uncultured Campylobacterales bacterium]|uniref:COG2907: Amine oxidase, flavin-containing n=1 Tax=uncultured Campylobacterales bacterium TaxID=352960 RepID=A0A6S6SZ77_9BACT|nr:MAG: COG2907: Amine oxidase, flavin-containing [uncultured Campylobacterales bacterium]
MKVAVIGGGISGLGASYILSQKYEVDLYEKDSRLGGHARTTTVNENSQKLNMDTGFLVFNYETYPNLTKLFAKLDVKVEKSDMTFGFWDEDKNIAYNAASLSGMFFQKKNIFSLKHYKMIFDILKFNKKANNDLKNNSIELNLPLDEYLKKFSQTFKDRYILPMGAAIWSTPSDEILSFPTLSFLRFFQNHGLLGITTQHQWYTVSNGSINYVKSIVPHISGKVILNSDIVSVRREKDGVYLINKNNKEAFYDKVIFATHAPDTLSLISNPSQDEIAILGSFKYKGNKATLHSDKSALYPNKKIYAAWNYKKSSDISLSYWINKLQNLKSKKDYFVTLNDTQEYKNTIEKIEYSHPQFNENAINAQKNKDEIDGKNHTYFCGAYWRYGFHEDGLWSATKVAKKLGCEL